MHLGGLVTGVLIGILMHAQRQLLRPPVPPRPHRADACKRAPVTSAVHPNRADACKRAPVTSAVDAVPVHTRPTTAPRALRPQASVPVTLPDTTPAVDASLTAHDDASLTAHDDAPLAAHDDASLAAHDDASLAAHAAAAAGSVVAGSAAPAQWSGTERTLAFIRQLRAEAASPEAFDLALSTVATLVHNVLTHPEETKYRTVRLTNAAFHARLGQYLAAVALLRSLGFEYAHQGGADASGQPTHLAIAQADTGQLVQCLELIEAARQANRQVATTEERLRDRLNDRLRDWARHLRVTIASLRARRGLTRAQRAIAMASGVLLLLVCVVAATVMGDPAVRAFFQRCDVCQLLNCVEVLDWYSCCLSSVPGSCALRFEDHNQTILTAQCNVTGTFTSFEASCDVGPRCQWDPDDRASRNLMCERLCRGC
jgi:hypothetical protein